MSPKHQQAAISIEGWAGIGASRMAYAAASRAIEQQDGWGALDFDTVAWVAAPRTGMFPPAMFSCGQVSARLPVTAAPPPRHYLQHVICAIRAAHRLLDFPASHYAALDPDRRIQLALACCEDSGASLLILDGIHELDAQETNELRAFLRYLPRPSKAILTMRECLRLGFPVRLTPLRDAEMDQLIKDACGSSGLRLNESERLAVREGVYGFPSLACEVLHRIPAEGVRNVLPRLPSMWDTFADGVFGPLRQRLSGDASASLGLLCALASSQELDICAGEPCRTIAANCGGIDPEECEELLRPLLLTHLITRLKDGRFAMSRAAQQYFA